MSSKRLQTGANPRPSQARFVSQRVLPHPPTRQAALSTGADSLRTHIGLFMRRTADTTTQLPLPDAA